MDQQPRTIPPEDATVVMPRRRRSFIDDTDLLSLEDPVTVSRIIPRTTSKGEQRILALNYDNPIVRAAMDEGKLAIARLAGCEIAEHVAFEFRSSVRDALQLRNELRYRHALLLAANPEYQKLVISKKK